MENNCEFLVLEAQAMIEQVSNNAELENAKAIFFGANGKLKTLFKLLSHTSPEEKPLLGQKINQCKTTIESIFTAKRSSLEEQEIANNLGEKIDPSMEIVHSGTVHPLSKIQEMMAKIFGKIGFTIALGTEIETSWFCYDALNLPDFHPARDTHDSFFLSSDLIVDNVHKHGDENYILRSHTSTVQIRTMLLEQPPLRVISPGRTFRRDTPDMTHSPIFHQCEGLVVDRDISVTDLKAVLDFFFKELFGDKCATRFRPSFFPFTEPSFEVDFRAPNVGKLSNKWVEIAGCGTVHPNVFQSVGYDPEQWSGYAFGFGLERIAMLMYGIDDIRLFYQNDSRFLKQFS